MAITTTAVAEAAIVAKQDVAVTFWMEVACYEMTILL
jgi:hypothetical protein